MSDRKNSEGYSDPTAYQAMMNLEIEELRFKKLLRSIHTISVYSNNSEESPLYEENILAKLREFAPVLSNLR